MKEYDIENLDSENDLHVLRECFFFMSDMSQKKDLRHMQICKHQNNYELVSNLVATRDLSNDKLLDEALESEESSEYENGKALLITAVQHVPNNTLSIRTPNDVRAEEKHQGEKDIPVKKSNKCEIIEKILKKK